MSTPKNIAITLALALAIGFVLSYSGDDVADAKATAAAARDADEAWNRDFVGHKVCGPEAAFEWRGDDLQCITHSGKRTGKPMKVASPSPLSPPSASAPSLPAS